MRCATSCRSRSPVPNCIARVGDVREPYRELLRSVRTRMRATRDGIERLLQVDEEMPSPAEIYLDAADLMADLCLCHRSLEATGTRLDRQRPVDRSAATRIGVWREAGAARYPPGCCTAHRGLAGDYISAGAGMLRRVERAETARVPWPRAHRPPSRSSRQALETTPEVRDVLDTFTMIGAPAAGVARRLRDHDDACSVGRAGSGVAAERGSRRRAASHGAALRDGRAIYRAPSTSSARCSHLPWYRSRIDGPAGSDARLFGFSQRRRAADRRLGSLQSTGSHCRHGWATRCSRDALSRPRRQRRTWRRSDTPGAAIAASGFTGRHASGDRAGRDAAGPLRLPRHRCAGRWRCTRPVRSKLGCGQAAHRWRNGASAWSVSLPMRAPRTVASWTSDPRFPDYFRSATPEAEIDELNHRQPSGASRNAGRRARSARDPLAVRLDADAADARRVAWRRGGASIARSSAATGIG